METRKPRDSVSHRRRGGSFVIAGLLAGIAVSAFMLLGGELSFGLTAPKVRIDAANALAE